MQRAFKILWIVVSLSFGSVLLAQTSDSDLAQHYFTEGEFAKATLYLEKLYKQKKSDDTFEKLLTCYNKTQAFRDSEKLVKSHFGREYNIDKMIYLTQIYDLSEDKNLASSLSDFENTKYRTSADLIKASEYLINANHYEVALTTLKKNQEKLSAYNYYLYRARIYGGLGQMQEMIDQYVEIVLDNPAYQRHVQSSLSRYLNFTENEEESEMLRVSLLKAQQKSNYNPAVTELLYWYYLQIKDFESAFGQLKAMSKRQGPQVERLQGLAALIANNENYQLAFNVFDFMLELGGLDELRKEIAQAKRVTYAYAAYRNRSTEVDYPMVQDYFSEFTSSYPLNEGNCFLYLDYIDFKFKVDKDSESAKTLCDEIISKTGLYDKNRALAKLKKADILVSQGFIWEASLLNSQVDLDFKNDDLGGIAKMKNAKIAFYAGDFEWSQAQLDIIKASTSDVISNDAIDLSLVITDNLNLDTSSDALFLYAQADLALLQNNTDKALQLLDSITSTFPTHSLNDEILWKKYQLSMAINNIDKAQAYLEQLINQYYYDIYADDAAFYLAQLLEIEKRDFEKAKEYYEKVITDFPESIYAIQARKRLRVLRKDIIKFQG